jgi:hypothetical protein
MFRDILSFLQVNTGIVQRNKSLDKIQLCLRSKISIMSETKTSNDQKIYFNKRKLFNAETNRNEKDLAEKSPNFYRFRVVYFCSAAKSDVS